MISLTAKETALFRLKRRQRGATLLLFTFLVVLVMMPFIGLAIDGAIVFWTKAKLSAAVDGAALAAARSLSVGQTTQAQAGNATTLGVEYLNADFPSGWMGITTQFGAGNVDVRDDPNSLRTRLVTVNASVTVPLIFMRLLGQSNLTLGAVGQASRRDLNLILVLDRSGSMNTGGACGIMVAAAKNFLTNFAEGRDTVGLITFQTAANLDFPPSQTFKAGITAKLNPLICNGNTSSAEALSLAYQQIHTIDQQGALNVILFFTDGIPNGVVANFPQIVRANRYLQSCNTVNRANR